MNLVDLVSSVTRRWQYDESIPPLLIDRYRLVICLHDMYRIELLSVASGLTR